MALKKCCEIILFNCTPNDPKDGTFTEIVTCLKCGQRLIATFACEPVLGTDELACAVVGAEETK